ncbi:tripartite tricarboxylate transporter TctB family protein [Cryobacterium sp. Y62]|uniref:tripartite tricarboxylate transporter TctB family protein n=1 Tax=Cryobacterium sp. Y62 TaxID=2048284 RepID=UPI000CE35A59|nr:tripartite tricarboxylate transporter TctB family protein [Cryobacterium sp. Y62]
MTASEVQVGAPAPADGTGRFHRLIGPGVGLVIGLAIVALAQSIVEPSIATSFSPRWWPQILGGIVAALSLGVLVKEVVAPSAADDELERPTRAGSVRVIAVFVVIAAYGVMWYFITFPIATCALFVALAWLLGARGWKPLTIFPIVCTTVLYALFGLLLKVPL